MPDGADFKDLQRRMDGAIGAFKHDIASLRTGRASSNLLDAVQVQAYGSSMPINQVANVSVPEPRMISVSVWDKSMVGAVDRAIREANLGFNPIMDGTTLRIPLPELNEQPRKEPGKLAHGSYRYNRFRDCFLHLQKNYKNDKPESRHQNQWH